MYEAGQEELQNLVRKLPRRLEPYREMLLANLVMIAEIPAPTFEEARRVEFLKQRFTECGLQNVSTDQAGNALAVLPGTHGDSAILVNAHIDTPFSANVNHTLTVATTQVTGPGVADNSLGMAALATLPTLLEGIGLQLRSDLILMGATRSLGSGNLGGLRFFLTNNRQPVRAGLCVEGVQLGRLNYTSRASINCQITCRISGIGVTDDTARAGAIVVLNRVINHISELVPDDDPDLELVFGAIEGGTAFKTPARRAQLRFQIRCETTPRLTKLAEQIDTLTDDISARTGAAVDFEVTARSDSGGITANHPLTKASRMVITALDIEPRMGCCSSAASSFADSGIPAITVGITRGANLNQTDECVLIEPIFKGMAQVIGIIKAIDGGCCD
ncbi:MAG: peptidase dimerization domain-containing protein [Pseudomonadota bacterium]